MLWKNLIYYGPLIKRATLCSGFSYRISMDIKNITWVNILKLCWGGNMDETKEQWFKRIILKKLLMLQRYIGLKVNCWVYDTITNYKNAVLQTEMLTKWMHSWCYAKFHKKTRSNTRSVIPAEWTLLNETTSINFRTTL